MKIYFHDSQEHNECMYNVMGIIFYAQNKENNYINVHMTFDKNTVQICVLIFNIKPWTIGQCSFSRTGKMTQQ